MEAEDVMRLLQSLLTTSHPGCHMKWRRCLRDPSPTNKRLDTQPKAPSRPCGGNGSRSSTGTLTEAPSAAAVTPAGWSLYWGPGCSHAHRKHPPTPHAPPPTRGPFRIHSVCSFTSSWQSCNVNGWGGGVMGACTCMAGGAGGGSTLHVVGEVNPSTPPEKATPPFLLISASSHRKPSQS